MAKAIQMGGPYYQQQKSPMYLQQPQRRALGLPTMGPEAIGAERFGELQAHQEHMQYANEEQRRRALEEKQLALETRGVELQEEQAEEGKGGK